MEKISDFISSIDDQLVKIEDVFEQARGVPFSTRVSVNRASVYDIIDEIRGILDEINRNLPNEIRTASRVLSDRDKILSEAKMKAQTIVKEAESEAIKMLNEHEVLRQATAKAAQLDAESRRTAAQFRKNAIEYSDELLQKTEEAIRAAQERFAIESRNVEDYLSETINTLYSNRKELRGTRE